MKKIILLLFIISSPSIFWAQDCSSTSHRIQLEFNKLYFDNSQYGFTSLGLPKLDKLTGQYDSEHMPTLFYANQLWLGGTAETGEIRFSGATYPSSTNNYDFYPGPLDLDGTTYADQCQFWDRLFIMTKEDLKTAIGLLYNSDGSINNNVCDQLPESILLWPGRGNQALQPFTPAMEMAEFFDYNQDGIYDPCAGDLPMFLEENCVLNIQDVINTFPKILTFGVRNDAGGPHLLSAGEPLGIEIHDYYFAFEGSESLETALFSRHKIINKSTENYKNFHLGLWIDSDIGCAFDDFSGCDSKRNMSFFYNEDAVDGDNDSNCEIGSNTFDTEIPFAGITYLKGFLDDQNNDLGMTAAINTFNCGDILIDSSYCDPEQQETQFFNILKGLNRIGDSIIMDSVATNYMFDGNPADPTSNSMCNSILTNIDTRSIMSTGGVTFQSGQSRDVILAYYNTSKANLPCPDVNILLEVQDEIEALYNNCWKQTLPPDFPQLHIERINNDIEVKLMNDSTSNNIDESYEAHILGSINQSDSYKYKFEGYKVYQVKDRNTAISALDNPEYSWLVYQSDVNNNIKDISNWESIYNTDNVKSWKQEQKVEGTNSGIEHSFTLDYDYLNNRPIERNQEYYLVAVAYGYNNYKDFNPIDETGQKSLYIQSENLKVITVGKAVDNNQLAPQITRLSGQGNMNDLEITEQSYANIIAQSNGGEITYEVNKGPFDITVIDESLISNLNKFKLKVTGPWDNSSAICAYDPNETFIEVTDLNSGEIYVSDQPISNSKDHIFDELGLMISLHNIDSPGDQFELTNGGINQRIKYNDKNGLKWLGSIHDGRPLPPDLNLNIQNKATPHDKDQYYKDFGVNLFFPMALNNSSSLVENTISTTASSLFRLVQNTRSLNFTNIDIVFTPDKSLWSRCIVVETANKNYNDLIQGEYSFLQVKNQNSSVDKNGIPDGTGKGMGWFPGYAINVETGQRLNIFFGENSALKNPIVPILDPSITNDMVWNPTDEYYNNNDPSLNPLLKGIYGGHHFIYVTKTQYDECAQLKEALNPKNFSFRYLESIAWTTAPVINSGIKLLPISEGLIPNEAKISIRVNNKFSKEGINQDLERLRRCDVYDDSPVYEFTIVENPNYNQTIDQDIMLIPWSIINQINNFKIFNIEEDVIVTLLDLSSNELDQWTVKSQEELELKEADFPNLNGIYIIRVRSMTSGIQRSYKIVVMK